MASTSTPSGKVNNVIKHERLESCFGSWLTQERNDLAELTEALGSSADDKKLKQLVVKNIKHLEEYHNKRALLAQHDAPCFLSPSCCTSLEKFYFWLGGFRPSLFIRLVYSISGSELEAQPHNLLRVERKGNLGDISHGQLTLINSLHCKAVGEEDGLSTEMATLQENIAEVPFLMVAAAKKWSSGSVEGGLVELKLKKQDDDIDAFEALDLHVLPLAEILVEADKLRLNIFKALLIEILTPLQGADLLVAYKQLHLSLHEWGKKRDQQHFRN